MIAPISVKKLLIIVNVLKLPHRPSCSPRAMKTYMYLRPVVTCSTVDRENFAVKIISRSRPTAKNKLCGDDQ